MVGVFLAEFYASSGSGVGVPFRAAPFDLIKILFYLFFFFMGAIYVIIEIFFFAFVFWSIFFINLFALGVILLVD